MRSEHKKAASKAGALAPDDRRGALLRSVLLAAFVALCVARPLLPSEGVSWLGDGQPFDLLAMLITAGYLTWAISRGGLSRPLGVVDAAVAVLVVVCATSALAGAHEGTPRMAINMVFEWIGMGLTFFLARQLVATTQEARMLVAVMLALSVVLAAFGFYQVFVSLPADRAAYADHPDELLRSLGQWFPPGSPERLRFEDRLRSTEPLATFALTNSLAGFLAPWLVVALGICGSVIERGRGSASSAQRIARLAALAACLAAVAGCFLLTKSRAGYVAVGVGAALLPFSGGRRLLARKILIVGGVGLAVLVVGAIAIRGLDVEVLTEASKSLGYRWQYWQSTLAMIRQHAVLGVGPGNFQDYYTQYKLPEASEEIRDPHNFLLEVWATGGTLALAALCMALGAFAWHMRSLSGSVPEEHAASAESPPARATGSVKSMAVGAASGFLFAFVIGPAVGLAFSEEQMAGGLLVGAIALVLVWPWVAQGTLPARLPALGLLVLTIDLLAAGGITFPGVAGTFWILLALGLAPPAEQPSARGARARWIESRPVLVGALGATCAVAAACYFLAYAPVLGCRAAMTMADEQLRQHPQSRPAAYRRAALADPLSAEPWAAIAELEFERLMKDTQDVEAHERFVEATERIAELRPHSSAAWRQVGRWYGELYENSRRPEAATASARCLRRAADLYPNLATLQAELALALRDVGEPADARRHAERAVELDAATPHTDKKISARLRQQIAGLLAEPR